MIPNERPIWTESSYSFSVRERQPAGTKVGMVKAWEHGSDLNQHMCSYTIVRPQDAPFDVDGNGTPSPSPFDLRTALTLALFPSQVLCGLGGRCFTLRL